MKPRRPEPAPRTEGLTNLDRDRAASVADEGGGSAAHIDAEAEAEAEDPTRAARRALLEKRRERKARRSTTAAFALATLVLVPSVARAETYITPFAGLAFSGDTDDSKVTWGAGLTLAPADGGLGFNVDFARTSDFFGTSRFLDNSVTTLTGNLVLMSPGRTRFYGVAGGGLMKARVSDAAGLFDIDSNDFGIDVGGGLMAGGEGPIGFQADVRYFRALQDPEPDDEFDVDFGELDYWRAYAGISIRF